MAKMAGRWSDGVPLSLAPTSRRGKRLTEISRRRLYRRQVRLGGTLCGTHEFHLSGRSRRAQMPDDLPYAAGQYARHAGSDRRWHGSVLNNRRRILRRGLPYGDPTHRVSDADEHGHRHAGRLREPVPAVRIRATAMDQLRARSQARATTPAHSSAIILTEPGGENGPKAKFVIPADPRIRPSALYRRGHSAIRRDTRRRIFLRAEHDRLAHDRYGRGRPHVKLVTMRRNDR